MDSKQIQKKLRQRVRQHVRQLGNQTVMAEVSGVDLATVSRFVRGKQVLTMPTAERLARAVGCELRLVERGRST